MCRMSKNNFWFWWPFMTHTHPPTHPQHTRSWCYDYVLRVREVMRMPALDGRARRLRGGTTAQPFCPCPPGGSSGTLPGSLSYNLYEDLSWNRRTAPPTVQPHHVISHFGDPGFLRCVFWIIQWRSLITCILHVSCMYLACILTQCPSAFVRCITIIN